MTTLGYSYKIKKMKKLLTQMWSFVIYTCIMRVSRWRGLTKFYLFKTIPWETEGAPDPLWIRACFDDDDDDDDDDDNDDDVTQFPGNGWYFSSIKMCLIKSSFNRARIIIEIDHCLKMSILIGVVERETGEQNKTEYQGIKLQ